MKNLSVDLGMLLLHMFPIEICIPLALFAIKVYLFNAKKTERWKPFNILYFQRGHIWFSSSDTTKNQKVLQNNLSLVILAIVALEIIIKAMI